MNFLTAYIVQKKLRAAQPNEFEIESDSCKILSFEEENGVRYMGGFVVKKLTDCSDFNELWCVMMTFLMKIVHQLLGRML